MKTNLEEIKDLINEAKAIVIGAGSGLSAAAGFEYGGKTFKDNFEYMAKKYHVHDMYSAGFAPFESEEEFWGYWSKFIYLERYKDGAKPLYQELLRLMHDKNYFVITTNVDHQFQWPVLINLVFSIPKGITDCSSRRIRRIIIRLTIMRKWLGKWWRIPIRILMRFLRI